jgi:hypothetical protein
MGVQFPNLNMPGTDGRLHAKAPDSLIRKSGYRFSEKIMLKQEKIMLKQKDRAG